MEKGRGKQNWLRHTVIIVIIAVSLFLINTLWLGSTAHKTVSVNESQPKVYITKSGDKYHNVSCGYLHSSSIPIGKYEAEKKGYTACSVCGGTTSGTITVSHIESKVVKGNAWNSQNIILNVGLVVFAAPTLYIFFCCIVEKKEKFESNKKSREI